jgi:copper chaperone CopZ
VRSALLSVNGVTRARVTLEEHEALVTYDPARASVADLLEAVKKAQGPSEYSAEVKGKGQF